MSHDCEGFANTISSLPPPSVFAFNSLPMFVSSTPSKDFFFAAGRLCYIVYLGAHSHGPTPSSIDLETATSSHYDLLVSTLGSQEKAKEAIIYSYNKQINGFAAILHFVPLKQMIDLEYIQHV